MISYHYVKPSLSRKQREIPTPIMEGYNFKFLKHPSDNKRGGVGIFYKEAPPLTITGDLSYDECLVCEIHIGNREIFYSLIYRSPSNHAMTPEFHQFLSNFENLAANISAEKPHAFFYIGDFIAHCQNWWPSGDTNEEVSYIDELTSSLGLHQLISDPTNFEPNTNPSCIDLISCGQPSIVMETGVRSSPHNFCKHQVLFGKLKLHIPPPSAFYRNIWYYTKANNTALKQAISQFDWKTNLVNHHPSWQVSFFNKTLLNIMSNFILNSGGLGQFLQGGPGKIWRPLV